jgi:hypothetical protein
MLFPIFLNIQYSSVLYYSFYSIFCSCANNFRPNSTFCISMPDSSCYQLFCLSKDFGNIPPSKSNPMPTLGKFCTVFCSVLSLFSVSLNLKEHVACVFIFGSHHAWEREREREGEWLCFGCINQAYFRTDYMQMNIMRQFNSLTFTHHNQIA